MPDSVFVPDLLIALTCTPEDRPWVASKRFEMNWNSAMESRLYSGWPPMPSCCVTCCPSTLSWYSRTSARSWTGVPPMLVVRLPGASSASEVQSRPWIGSSCICCWSMLPPIEEVATSRSGASAVTVTVSWRVDGFSCTSIAAVWPTSSDTPARVIVVKPCSSNVSWYWPIRAGIR